MAGNRDIPGFQFCNPASLPECVYIFARYYGVRDTDSARNHEGEFNDLEFVTNG